MEHQPAGVDLLLLPHPGRLHSRQQHRALDNLRYKACCLCVDISRPRLSSREHFLGEN